MLLLRHRNRGEEAKEGTNRSTATGDKFIIWSLNPATEILLVSKPTGAPFWPEAKTRTDG